MPPRSLAPGIAVLALMSSAPARAEQPAFGTVVRQEWIGAEVANLSFNLGSPPYGDDHPSRLQPGVGLQLRLFRHRWRNGPYWTPLQMGSYYGWGRDGDWTFFAGAQTEVGGVLRIGDQILELGLGAGFGMLAIRYGEINTSALVLGGLGLMASPVVRYLFREARSHTLGLVVRAEIPLSPPPESAEHPAYGGRGMLFLLGFDAGFGRS